MNFNIIWWWLYKFVTILSPLQVKSLHGGVRCSRSAHLTQVCCDFFEMQEFCIQVKLGSLKLFRILIDLVYFCHSLISKADGGCQHAAIQEEVGGRLKISAVIGQTRALMLGLSLVKISLFLKPQLRPGGHQDLHYRWTETGLQYKCTAVQLITSVWR